MSHVYASPQYTNRQNQAEIQRGRFYSLRPVADVLFLITSGTEQWTFTIIACFTCQTCAFIYYTM